MVEKHLILIYMFFVNFLFMYFAPVLLGTVSLSNLNIKIIIH